MSFSIRSKRMALLATQTTLLLPFLISGCRLGNNIQRSVTPDDPYTGYYLTEVKGVSFFATTNQTVSKTVAVSSLPTELSQVFTNPVGLNVRDTYTGKSVFQSSTGNKTLPITIGKNLAIGYNGTSDPETLWKDPDCQTYLQLQEVGSIVRSSTPLTLTGNTLPLSGRIELTVQVTNWLQGNCTTTLQELYQCYGDVTQCGSSDATENQSTQDAVIAFFEPYIDAQAIVPADIPNLVNYGYAALYE